MPRRKPTTRKDLKKARQAVLALEPSEREKLIYDGIGPGDSYIGLWRMINNYRHRVRIIQGRLAADEARSPDERMSPSDRHALREDERYYAGEIGSLYRTVLAKEKASLQSVTLKGDPRNPLHMAVDLSGLPDEDLDALARIIPKLAGGTGPGHLGEDHLLTGPRGEATPKGKPRARGD